MRDVLGPDDVLVANFRLTDSTKDHEADLILLLPNVGIVVLEVKGGSVWHDAAGWWVKRGGKPTRIHPVDQARNAKYAIRDYVEGDPRWVSGRIAWAHGVITPFSQFPQTFTIPELPRSALHDRDDLKDLNGRMVDNALQMAHGRRSPTPDEIDLIREILTGRLVTNFDVEAEALERESTADRLTQEQSTILQVTRLLPRIEVRGGAGSGKTMLALQQAKQLTKGRNDRKPQRVALICYSLGLAEYLKRDVETWTRKERPAFVGTFHEFGIQWGAPPAADRSDNDFWEEGLPRQMDELASGLADKDKYDAIIVDEAQDFADLWWQPVLKSLRDEVEGGLYVYSDENQRLFARFGRPPVQLVPLVLDHNLRNTKQIHETFSTLAPSRMYSRGGDGVEVRFVSTTASLAIDTADDEIDRLLDRGWQPEDVCLLTTGNRHPVQIERAEAYGQEGYWQSFWDNDDVFYGHVLGCKGLERRAVVLCINEDKARDRARERLYVGLSRATDQLVVVGDPTYIRDVGGPAVARKLGIESLI